MQPRVKFLLAGIALIAAVPTFRPRPEEASTPLRAGPAAAAEVPPSLTPGSRTASLMYSEDAATALRLAARHDAQKQFFMTAARCMNDVGVDLPTCINEARLACEQAFELADYEYEARIDIGILLFGDAPYDPVIVPADFSPNVTNPFHPLVVGQTRIYHKQTAEGLEVLVNTVLPDTQMVNGIECRQVYVVESLNGEIHEETLDWFAQKNDGSVWYFGELTKHFTNGLLDDIQGSWRYGKNDAKPGIVMPATPAVGVAYRQEFDLGVAEDIGRVLQVNQSVTVPTGTYTGCVVTHEITPLSPLEQEDKVYAPGIGLVKEMDTETGEETELIQIIN